MPSSSRRNQDILAIARLHYEERLAQNEVAERLGISASTVSRALKKAHDLGFVEIRIVPSALRDEDCEKRLVERFGLRAAVVVQSRETLAEARRLLGAALAYHLDPLIAENDVIGISDGQTVAAVAAAMRRARARNISVVPLIGGIGLPQLPTHPAEVSRVMAENLGAESWNLPVPATTDTAEAAEILRGSSSTRRVFEMMGRLDHAIVGVGAIDDAAAIVRHGVVTTDQMRLARKAGAVGTICGRFYDSKGHPVRFDLDDRTLAVTLEQLAHCPRRIAAACGGEKVEAIRAALAGRLVNVVATDAATADAIMQDAD